jgi:8-oxo-dGTP pyrophosphatase MutT (NUDIX family)
VKGFPIFEYASAVDCTFEPRPWAWAEANAAHIDAHWERLRKATPALFDGEVLVLHRGGVEDGVFRGAYLKTRYSSFITARDLDFPDGITRNAFAMGALRSSDGAFLLGVMGDHTANPGKIYFPAGTPDTSDIAAGKVDLAASVAREMEEETGLNSSSLRFAQDWTVVSHGSRVALMRRVDIDMPADEARELILRNIASQEDPELAGIHVVRGEADLDERRMPAFMHAYLRWALGGGRVNGRQPAG